MVEPPPHVLNEKAWLLLKPHLPGSKGNAGRRARDNRLFLSAVSWKFAARARWADLPQPYGPENATRQRLARWRKLGVWERLRELFGREPGLEWLNDTSLSSEACDGD